MLPPRTLGQPVTKLDLIVDQGLPLNPRILDAMQQHPDRVAAPPNITTRQAVSACNQLYPVVYTAQHSMQHAQWQYRELACEAYLLRTRLQKMPYKHIAAHLNKTELACRLHYHQLSHGSSRRKRTASSSSGSDRSPVMPNLSPSPSAAAYERVSRSISPPRHLGGGGGRFAMTPPPQMSDVQLPGLLLSGGCSPRVPTILPKPASMGLGTSRASSPLGYPPSSSSSSMLEQQHPQQQQHPLPPVSFRRESSLPAPVPHHHSLPLPSTAMPPAHSPAHVDLNRLHSVYAAHRDKFWDLVAAEYGCSMGPATLEKAWKSGRCCGGGGGGPAYGPLASPKEDSKTGASRDKTRISSLISAD
ncbi:hypothetical protein ISF_08971 [Cordyceps fumosorosea ARSEF 2679]|uniref:Homeodomain-like protein n=1 Tax=Cordyceps fumosorosea (strain ARSEF 2679) TaxID=1081104 RepID=A0A162M9Y1_CORFA|nr:hypothetical protein ISF_08971 [Cordyceps fumosorosea ARSEF 2679]OAA53130.1 hypothetical protein ISF_08971 [Cordyceps fumosorosea ARSEF 2679]